MPNEMNSRISATPGANESTEIVLRKTECGWRTYVSAADSHDVGSVGTRFEAACWQTVIHLIKHTIFIPKQCLHA